ncbi:hypothetical protein BCR34DRAFT_563689 [Clohesyomyces aquaticus]|uniref:Uncharacterized protein n=1 Tax=Clohesyomyces aquaticus TaxID=1231657 RepID=A0A1Y1ZQV3_9PLEO|nr:hypothetical protein BCR34DRAFT_563689 [Clohesyomyces aquaticus]
MHIPSILLLSISCSNPICSDPTTGLALREGKQQISLSKASPQEIITEMKSRLGVQNLCCFECGTGMCCCNFNPEKETCDGHWCENPTPILIV